MKLIEIYPLLPDEFMVCQRVQLYSGEQAIFPIELVRKPVCEYLDFMVYQIIPAKKYVTNEDVIGIVI